MSLIKENKIYCGFCMKTPENLKKENKILHAGLEAFICDGCIENLIEIKSKKFKESKLNKKISSLVIS